MVDVRTMLKLLAAVGPVVARLPEFASVWDVAVKTFSGADQAELQRQYAELVAENDAGHQRLQDKLRAAGASQTGGP